MIWVYFNASMRLGRITGIFTPAISMIWVYFNASMRLGRITGIFTPAQKIGGFQSPAAALPRPWT
jgi:hypothetical protein